MKDATATKRNTLSLSPKGATSSDYKSANPSSSLVPMNTLYEEDAGGGFEQADKDSYAIPFLSILQSGSPQVKKSDGAYVPGAEEGMLFNTVTGLAIDGAEGVRVVPCYYRRSMVEWKPRDSGGGFVADYEVSEALTLGAKRDENNRDVLPNGNYLVDTRAHYVLLLNDAGGYSPAVITMTSTQLKKSKRWMSVMDGVKLKRADGGVYTPAMYSHVYTVTSAPEGNDKGSWMGWHIELTGPLTDANIYLAARKFRDDIRKGAVKAQAENLDPVPDNNGAVDY